MQSAVTNGAASRAHRILDAAISAGLAPEGNLAIAERGKGRRNRPYKSGSTVAPFVTAIYQCSQTMAPYQTGRDRTTLQLKISNSTLQLQLDSPTQTPNSLPTSAFFADEKRNTCLPEYQRKMRPPDVRDNTPQGRCGAAVFAAKSARGRKANSKSIVRHVILPAPLHRAGAHRIVPPAAPSGSAACSSTDCRAEPDCGDTTDSSRKRICLRIDNL